MCFYSEHPTTSIRFDESPLSEYRPCQGRTVMRRHFDSLVPRLANSRSDEVHPKLVRVSMARLIFARRRKLLIRRHRPDTASNGICPFNKKARDQDRKTQGETWPVSTTAIPPTSANAP